MRPRIVSSALCALAFLLTYSLASDAQAHSPTPQRLEVPLAFEQNQGQSDSQIQFLSRTGPFTLALTNRAAVLTRDDGASQSSVTFSWLHARADMNAAGEVELPSHTNYLVGDPQDWISNIPNFSRVRYRSIYPGVDLIYYGNHRQLEYDLELQPGADASRVAFAIDGARSLLPQVDGSLLIQTALGNLQWQRPVAYQVKNGQRIEVAASYRLIHDKDSGQNSAVTFALGPYDHTLPLTIDPTLTYAALIGPAFVQGYVATDSSGSAYLLTSTYSSAYPTTPGSYMPTFAGQTELLAITKFSPDGSSLVYSTYLGGWQFSCPPNSPGGPNNSAAAIAIDSSGNAIILGGTASTNFPTTKNAVQTSSNCNPSMTLSKLSADGSSLLYSTYLGPTAGYVYPHAVAVDSNDNMYVGGDWTGAAFPSTVNFSSCSTGCSNAFVGKINSDGSLGYSVLFGGENTQSPSAPGLTGLAVDSAGDLYMAGVDEFPIPTVNALQPTQPSGQAAYVGELNPAGTDFIFLTWLGGSNDSGANAIALDPSDNIYVTGFTFDNNFPLVNPFQSTNKGYGNPDAGTGFVTKYSPEGKSLVYSTYLGGSSGDALVSIAAGPDGKASVTGTTGSADYPVTPDAFQLTNLSPNQVGVPGVTVSAFTTLEPAGNALYYSTFLEGTSAQVSLQAQSIALTPNGDNAFIAGSISSQGTVNDFPVTPGAYDHPGDGLPNGTGDKIIAAFVMDFCVSCQSPANINVTAPLNGAVVTSPVNFAGNAYDPDGVAAIQIYVVPGKVAYQTTSSTFNTNLTIAPGKYNVVIQEWSKTGNYFKKTVSITVINQAPTVTITSPANGATLSNPVQVTATAKVSGSGTIVGYRVYWGNNNAVYTSYTSTLNAGINIPQGTNVLTVVAYDSTGAAGAASETITSNGGSGGALVTINSPVNNSTVASPVTFTAGAATDCPSGVYALQIYTNPGVLAYTAYASSVSKSISLSPGTYYGAVQAWDNCGGTFESYVTFKVQ